MTRLIVAGCFVIAALFTSSVNAQFSDNFDSYTSGSSLQGVNGWKGWDDSPGAASPVSNAQSCSAPNSVAIEINDDLINEMGNPTSGCWEYTLKQYIPSDLTGDTYFIMLSIYNDGSLADKQWSVQVEFNGADGTFDDNYQMGEQMIPIVFDQWVELRNVIDLDNDTLDQYYDGVLFSHREPDGAGDGGWSWNASGAQAIGAVDLFSAGGSTIYYDDIVLQPCPPPGPVIATEINVTEGTYISGDISDLATSDNSDYTIQRRSADLQSRTEFEVKSTSPTATPTVFEFTLEGSAFARGNVVQTIELFDYVANDWELVDTTNANRAPMPDKVVTATPTGDLSRFVEAGTMCIQARILYKSDRARQKFASNTDQLFWTIN